MNRAAFSALADREFAHLPRELLGWVENVVFLVEDWPDRETLDALGLEHPLDLLGLYQGNPLTERSVEWGGALPDRILLYQRPIEHWARVDGLDVGQVVRETLVHEIGHHLGLDEAELERLEARDQEDPDVP